MLTTLVVSAILIAGVAALLASKGVLSGVPIDPPLAETIFLDDLLTKLQALRENDDWRLVGIFGDDTRLSVLNDLADSQDAEVTKYKKIQYSVCPTAKLVLICVEEDPIVQHAIVASQVDVALIASDATIGPLPLVREHILLAANHRIPLVTGRSHVALIACNYS